MNTVVVGLQFGDEGKGKVVDAISSKYDIAVRFQGGPNAGHTVVVGGKRYKFHMLPAGIMGTGLGIIGNGCVVSPDKLMEEISEIFGDTMPNFKVSHRAHIILDVHVEMDGWEERMRSSKIGTTKRGIGPAYQDKVGRYGIRFQDLLAENVLEKKLENMKKRYEPYGLNFDVKEIKKKLLDFGRAMRERITDVSLLLNMEIKNGKSVLFEGAQGTLLDVDFGTYPFVTSSNTVAAQASVGSGVPITSIDNILGVAKAYITRVGQGPLPTEIEGEDAKKLRDAGGEYGTTTGRPRRVGWLDLPLLRYAAMINGVREIALTKIDVLGKMDEIYVCDKYIKEGVKYEYPPLDLNGVEPELVRFESWGNILENESVSDIPEVMEYIRFIEERTGIKVKMVSYGERRKDMEYIA